MQPIDHWLKASAAAAVLMAGAGVLYYFAMVLPEQARAPDARAATAAQPGLDHCRQAARLHYDVTWASACMVVASQEQQRHAECLRDGKGDPALLRARCDRLHGERDGASDCTLPDERAAVVNAAFKDADDRCVALAKRRAAP